MRVQGSGYSVQCVGCRVQGSRIRNQEGPMSKANPSLSHRIVKSVRSRRSFISIPLWTTQINGPRHKFSKDCLFFLPLPAPLSTEFGTYKTVKARLWPWLEPLFRFQGVGLRVSRPGRPHVEDVAVALPLPAPTANLQSLC